MESGGSWIVVDHHQEFVQRDEMVRLVIQITQDDHLTGGAWAACASK